MKTKKPNAKIKYLISFILIILVVPFVTGGGVVLNSGTFFMHDNQFKIIEHGSGYVPNQFYLEHKSKDTTLIPFLLHVSISEMPKTLVLNRYDITYLKKHEGYTHFQIDKLEIQFDGGKTVKMITDHHPLSDRVFQIDADWNNSIRFYNVISEESDFKFVIEGVSFSSDGKAHPYKYIEKYRSVKRIPLGVYFQKWAGV